MGDHKAVVAVVAVVAVAAVAAVVAVVGNSRVVAVGRRSLVGRE